MRKPPSSYPFRSSRADSVQNIIPSLSAAVNRIFRWLLRVISGDHTVNNDIPMLDS